MLLQRCLLIGVAGFIGALSRYGLSMATQRLIPSQFAWGTLVVNATACLIAGLLWGLSESRAIKLEPELRALIFIGFLGAFSTFSTFMLETIEMVHSAKFSWAAANLALQNVVGFVLAFAGSFLGRSL